MSTLQEYCTSEAHRAFVGVGKCVGYACWAGQVMCKCYSLCAPNLPLAYVPTCLLLTGCTHPPGCPRLAEAATASDAPPSGSAGLRNFLLKQRRDACAPVVMLVAVLAAGQLRTSLDFYGEPRLAVQDGVAAVEVMEAKASKKGASAAAYGACHRRSACCWRRHCVDCRDRPAAPGVAACMPSKRASAPCMPPPPVCAVQGCPRRGSSCSWPAR